jgi:hypothetical protein
MVKSLQCTTRVGENDELMSNMVAKRTLDARQKSKSKSEIQRIEIEREVTRIMSFCAFGLRLSVCLSVCQPIDSTRMIS